MCDMCLKSIKRGLFHCFFWCELLKIIEPKKTRTPLRSPRYHRTTVPPCTTLYKRPEADRSSRGEVRVRSGRFGEVRRGSLGRRGWAEKNWSWMRLWVWRVAEVESGICLKKFFPFAKGNASEMPANMVRIDALIIDLDAHGHWDAPLLGQSSSSAESRCMEPHPMLLDKPLTTWLIEIWQPTWCLHRIATFAVRHLKFTSLV